MKESRFIGGSVVRSFRLPKEHKEDCIKEINDVLDKYEDMLFEKRYPRRKATPTIETPKEVNSVKEDNPKTYNCGCMYDGKKFHKHKLCKNETHKLME